MLILWTLPCAGASYYVDAARPDDNGNGTGWASAKKTIAAGISLLSAGDMLYIATGTYASSLTVSGKSGTSSNRIRILTDDKSGNPGLVTLTGTVTEGGYGDKIGIYVTGSSYIEINGRQRNGFTVTAASGTHNGGVLVADGADGLHSNVKILYFTVNGSVNAGGYGGQAAAAIGYNTVEFGYCRLNMTGSDFIVTLQSWGYGDPNPTSDDSFHHCEIVQGTTSGGYSAIDLNRNDRAKVYNNYIHNVTDKTGFGSALLRIRQGHDCELYNNVIEVNGSVAPISIFQVRGTMPGDESARNSFYNNTIHMTTGVDEFINIADQSTSNKFFNNLVIGNLSGAMVGQTGALGSGNQLYNNVVTGTMNGTSNPTTAQWFTSSGLQARFSVQTTNYAGQGTSFVNLAGNKPSPYWDLSASKVGATIASLTLDYDGNARSSPPDVGAFEHGGGTALIPNPPTIISIN